MSDVYSIAVPSERKTYRIGKASSARELLPLFIGKKIGDKPFVLYHDGGFMEDKFEWNENYEVLDFNSARDDEEWLKGHRLTKEEFVTFFDKVSGKEITIKEFLSFLETK